MINNQHVIETEYDGYRFRSRLEARWAVFYNALEIPYEYEKEGFALPTWYLPDFWLPSQGCWIEIKGSTPTQEENNLAEALCEFTHANVFIFYGTIPNPDEIRVTGPEYEESSDSAIAYIYLDNHSTWDANYAWCECPKCQTLGIQFEARAARNCKCYPIYKPDWDRVFNGNSPKLLEAYREARQARFEH